MGKQESPLSTRVLRWLREKPDSGQVSVQEENTDLPGFLTKRARTTIFEPRQIAQEAVQEHVEKSRVRINLDVGIPALQIELTRRLQDMGFQASEALEMTGLSVVEEDPERRKQMVDLYMENMEKNKSDFSPGQKAAIRLAEDIRLNPDIPMQVRRSTESALKQLGGAASPEYLLLNLERLAKVWGGVEVLADYAEKDGDKNLKRKLYRNDTSRIGRIMRQHREERKRIRQAMGIGRALFAMGNDLFRGEDSESD